MSMKKQRRHKIEKRVNEQNSVGRCIEADKTVGRRAVQYARIRRISVSFTLFMLVLMFMTGWQPAQSQDASPPPAEMAPTPCTLEPIVVPTMPAEIPGYTELDPATQLHVTGTAKEIDLESYQLEVTGKVNHPLKLSYDDLRCLPKIEARPTLTCPGFFKDIATWAGASLKEVLELAGVQADARSIRLIGADGYSSPVSLADALSEKNFLAYEWEGEPVPILHGFPVRAVFQELEGNKWVKWLIKIEVY